MALDLTSSANWSETYRQLARAQEAPNARGYIPIPDMVVPVPIFPGLITIECNSQEANSWWWLACTLRADIDPPVTEFQKITILRQRLPLNRGTVLVQLPNLGSHYELAFEIPFWHREMSIVLWQYVGPDEPTSGVVYVP